jgi:hypothetical protein
MVGLLPLERLFAAVAFFSTRGLLATVFDLNSRGFTARFFTAPLLRIGCFFVAFLFFALGVDFFAAVNFLGVGFDLVCLFLLCFLCVCFLWVCFLWVFFLAAISGVYHRCIGTALLPNGPTAGQRVQVPQPMVSLQGEL